jgi:hypothetical protein
MLGKNTPSMNRSMKPPQHIDIEKLIAQATDSKGFLRWPLPLELESSPAVAYRNNFARALAKKSVPEILRSYVYLTQKEMKACWSLRLKECLMFPFMELALSLEPAAACSRALSQVGLK